jgi:hypothetical protein
MEILRKSTCELGMLKDHLERLVLFFSTLETNIANDALKEVGSFLKLIEQNSEIEDDVVMHLHLRNATKKVCRVCAYIAVATPLKIDTASAGDFTPNTRPVFHRCRHLKGLCQDI